MRRIALSLLFALPLLFAGCQQGSAPVADAHDHDAYKAPTSLADAATMLSDYVGDVESHLRDGDPKAADGPMHNLSSVLTLLPTLARTAGLADDKITAIEAAADGLVAALKPAHDAVHVGQSFDFTTIATAVQEALTKLTALLAPVDAAAPAADAAAAPAAETPAE